MKTVLHIIKKEFLQFKRDPKMFMIILAAPVVQLIILGYAATLDVKTVHTALYDMDRTQKSREYTDKFVKSGYFDIDYYITDYETLSGLIDHGDVTLGLVIPEGFEEKLYRGEPAPVQAIFDGSDGNTGSIAAGYVNAITADFSRKILLDKRQRSGRSTQNLSQIEAKTRVWYNPELKTRNFMVPGIVGLLLMIITIILTSLAIVKEKEIGTLEQLMVTPVKPWQLILGKLIPFAVLGMAAIIIVLAAMYVVFGIGVRGSIVFLFFATFIFILSTLGFGLFVSTISKTQQQSMMLAIFAIMLPMIYLSGFAFPIENMPEVIQWITYIIPLRYFMTIIRGVILKGIGLPELWIELTVLLGMGVSILALSAARFNKRLG